MHRTVAREVPIIKKTIFIRMDNEEKLNKQYTPFP